MYARKRLFVAHPDTPGRHEGSARRGQIRYSPRRRRRRSSTATHVCLCFFDRFVSSRHKKTQAHARYDRCGDRASSTDPQNCPNKYNNDNTTIRCAKIDGGGGGIVDTASDRLALVNDSVVERPQRGPATLPVNVLGT